MHTVSCADHMQARTLDVLKLGDTCEEVVERDTQEGVEIRRVPTHTPPSEEELRLVTQRGREHQQRERRDVHRLGGAVLERVEAVPVGEEAKVDRESKVSYTHCISSQCAPHDAHNAPFSTSSFATFPSSTSSMTPSCDFRFRY